MYLLFDLGNSRCKWALADPALQARGALGYEEFAAELQRQLGDVARPQRVLAVSVAGGGRDTQLAEWVRARWNVTLEPVGSRAAQLGVTNGYLEPLRLGADRWAALVGARARVPGPACVVDCGTAITIDLLDGAGLFRGGVILAGLELQRMALWRGTQGVRTENGSARSCLARSAADGVAAGAHYGIAGAIERIVEEQARALRDTPTILVTGGDAPALAPLLRPVTMHVPDLVLEGVARIAAEPAP